jgi:hypothetical protein
MPEGDSLYCISENHQQEHPRPGAGQKPSERPLSDTDSVSVRIKYTNHFFFLVSSLSRRKFLSLAALVPFVPSFPHEKRGSTACDYTYCVSSTNDALPVDLVSFDATRTNEAVMLRWRTASERDNAGFSIHHRPPNAGWGKIGFVEGAGTARQPQSYRFEVEQVDVPGTHQFRLHQVDYDGTRTRHDPTSIRIGLKKALRLTPPAPNPVSSTATLRVGSRDDSQVVVALYNGLGQRVATLYDGTPPPNELQSIRINAQSLSSGSYFVRATTNDHTRTRRVMIVR